MQRILLILLGIFLLAASPTRPVIVSIAAPELEIAAGEKKAYTLELNITKGFHIQSNPASGKYLVPVTATIEPTSGIAIGKPVYPPGVLFRLKGSKTDISTYEGNVRIKIPIGVPRDAKDGDVALKGTLRYQGCDAILCFPPAKLPFEIKLKIK